MRLPASPPSPPGTSAGPRRPLRAMPGFRRSCAIGCKTTLEAEMYRVAKMTGTTTCQNGGRLWLNGRHTWTS
jgi:hypothetical protein